MVCCMLHAVLSAWYVNSSHNLASLPVDKCDVKPGEVGKIRHRVKLRHTTGTAGVLSPGISPAHID